jgi:hypothetical protein
MITSKTHSPSTIRKMWITSATHLKIGVETSQLKVTSTLETNIMIEQTWVATKALWHKAANKSSRIRSKYNMTDALHIAYHIAFAHLILHRRHWACTNYSERARDNTTMERRRWWLAGMRLGFRPWGMTRGLWGAALPDLLKSNRMKVEKNETLRFACIS